MRTIRLAFTAGVACLQLFLLPASQLLHVACDHSHESAGSAPHSHAHCAHHHHNPGSPKPSGDKPDQDSRFPHDSGDCALCQIILAAQIDDLHDVQVPASDLIFVWTGLDQTDAPPAPLAVLSGRGPPA